MSNPGTSLGVGIYTPAEAAFYAKVSTQVMTRWVLGDKHGRPVIERQFRDSDEKVVTFLDLIQALAVREVRQRYQVPLQRIRDGVDEAITRYGIEFPLAKSHRIFLFGDPGTPKHQQLVIRLEGDEAEMPEYIQLTGHHKGNRMIGPVVETFLSHLDFDQDTRLATRYRPMREGEASVVLDPGLRFGEPLVMPGGYTAEALWQATSVEGSFENAASACGVSLEEVELANKYFETLLPLRAA